MILELFEGAFLMALTGHDTGTLFEGAVLMTLTGHDTGTLFE